MDASVAFRGREFILSTANDAFQASYGAGSLAQRKGPMASFALVPYALLQVVGFRPDAAPGGNDPQALLALQVLFIAVPAVLMVAAAWVLRGYPLTPARHDAIRAALDARDGAPA